DLELEELDDEAGVGPGENDLRAVDPLLDRFDIAAEALPGLVLLGGDAFAVGEQGLVLAKIDNDIGTVEPPDGAADDITDAVFELGEDKLLFRPPDMLH